MLLVRAKVSMPSAPRVKVAPAFITIAESPGETSMPLAPSRCRTEGGLYSTHPLPTWARAPLENDKTRAMVSSEMRMTIIGGTGRNPFNDAPRLRPRRGSGRQGGGGTARRWRDGQHDHGQTA